MKKTLLSLVLSFVLLLTLKSSVLAQTPTPSASPSANKVDYALPYPGMLPDNALYPLKMLRDRILDFFIQDPVKKTEFLILMADKRLAAGETLINFGKIDLGASTISKGENYLWRAVETASGASKQKAATGSLLDKLQNSVGKHIEVLQGVLLKAPESAKPGLTNALQNAQKGYQRVLEIKKFK